MITRLLRAVRAGKAAPPAAAFPAGRASAAGPATVSGCEPVNGYRLLEQVVALPVSTWRYHWDPPQVRHLGPMAQDWWAAFGIGENDKTICCTDTNGVAIVAIQALHRQLSQTQQELSALRQEIERLREHHEPSAPCSEDGRSTTAEDGGPRPDSDAEHAPTRATRPQYADSNPPA
ncbi:hypothetical protein [Streptomyces flaveolus]|uniref:hypothetical protein n=1 Tax=Streptomyces flaveolus TaxID=67297 RepID=UPI0037004B5C